MSLKKAAEASDSINNVILGNSMQGFQDELRVYDVEREAARIRTITMGVIILLLLLLILALGYILFSHRRHMSQLKRAYEHALESDKMKTAFINNVSHEVRTPLNIIAGFAQVLADPDLSPDVEKRKEMARLIQKNNYLITSQIDEMLELSLNETSGAVSKDDHVVVNTLLKQIVLEKLQFASTNVSMVMDSHLSDDFTITTHRDMLHRALVTLVDNAIKYTTEGSITLSASATDGQLTITVDDTGCGIPEADAERVFERFARGSVIAQAAFARLFPEGAFWQMFAVLLLTRTPIRWSFLLLPVPIVCLFALCLGVGLLLASSMVFFQDTQFLWSVLCMLWMYVTPIFYPESILPRNLLPLFKCNPLYHILRFVRTILMDGISPEPKAYLLMILVSFLPLAAGIFVFKKTQDRFVLYI